MVDQNDAAFRELEEEMRRERFAAIWKRYGIYIVLLAAAIVVGVAGSQIWESWSRSQAESTGTEYDAAAALVEAGKIDEAAAAFGNIAASGPRGFATLASLSEAGILLKQDKRAEALAIFDRLAEDRSADPLLSNLSRLQAASLKLGEADFTEMENRLKPLTGDNSAWRYVARELLGTAAFKAGKLDEARTILSPLLVDPEMPRGSSERISRLMADIATAELPAVPAPASAATPAPDAANPAPAATPTPDSAKQAPASDAEKPASAP